MLLNYSLIFAILITLFIKNTWSYALHVLITLFLVILLINIIFNSNFKSKIKNLKYLIALLLSIFLIQIISLQEGSILLNLFNYIYITKEGVILGFINVFRVINIMFLSYLIDSNSLLKIKFLNKHSSIIEITISKVPEIFNYMQKKLTLKSFYRVILKDVNIKIKKMEVDNNEV